MIAIQDGLMGGSAQGSRLTQPQRPVQSGTCPHPSAASEGVAEPDGNVRTESAGAFTGSPQGACMCAGSLSGARSAGDGVGVQLGVGFPEALTAERTRAWGRERCKRTVILRGALPCACRGAGRRACLTQSEAAAAWCVGRLGEARAATAGRAVVATRPALAPVPQRAADPWRSMFVEYL